MAMADDGALDSPWRVVPHRLGASWSKAFRRAREQPSIRVDVACPDCGVTALRQFYVRHRKADPAELATAPQWLQDRARRNANAADGVEWCAHCRLFDHVKDKSAPPWWPESTAGVEPGTGDVHRIIGVVTAYLSAHGDPQ
ncbi:hypothetical protein ACFFSW_17430 [Saccharothrix longispora]|uniref:HNH endonuclease n=1 Tax=Saccharothrix longispora TaxID=33920 RepID=A0ABU1PPJ1_9PSEU|nr:hypothetical protein [Saccharothrix longispora]MDR6592582.1 hypothetical protein [Saccharothrix longispora]